MSLGPFVESMFAQARAHLRLAIVAATYLAALAPPGCAAAAETQYGIKAGLNLSYLSGDYENVEDSLRFGFAVGTVITYDVVDWFSFQPEFLFSMKGEQAEEVSASLDYIEVPLLARFNLGRQRWVPHLFAGPAPGYLLSSSSRVIFVGGDGTSLHPVEQEPLISDDETPAAAADYRSFDIGLVFGGGVEYRFRFTTLSFDARYNLGLLKIYSGQKLSWEPADLRNRTISLLTGIKF